MLIDAKADLNVQSASGSPLLIAFERRDHALVQLLVEAKANVDVMTVYHETPLLGAVRSGDTQAVKFWLPRGRMLIPNILYLAKLCRIWLSRTAVVPLSRH